MTDENKPLDHQDMLTKKPLPKQPFVFLAGALFLGWVVDFLFYGYEPGITIAIWILLALGVLVSMAIVEKVKPAPYSYVLMALIVACAVFTLLRLEPLTMAANTVAALFGLLLLASTLTHGFWPFYRLLDYLAPLLVTLFGGIPRPFGMFGKREKDTQTPDGEKHPHLKVIFSILRGLILVAPILLVLGGLLASADPIFKEQMHFFFDWFTIDRIPEYLVRGIFVVFYSFIFLCVLLQAVLPENQAHKPDPTQPLLRPFLGWIETVIIFGGINLMFLIFVIIQANYLFGGYQNIAINGYTYAEYARNGFGELIAVAILSLGIYLVLDAVSKREAPARRRWFSGLTVMLILQVLVMLVSSFQRLGLYETAYGFTRLRMYTHVFIFCLAALLLAIMILDVLRIKGRFGMSFLLFCYGFTFALDGTNVDAMITRQNIVHSTWHIQQDTRGGVLDYDYLRSLSNDSTLQLIASYANEDLPLNTHEKIGALLTCRNYAFEQSEAPNWRSFHPVTAAAQTRLAELASQLNQAYRINLIDGEPFAIYGDNQWQCNETWDDEWMD